MTILRAKTIDLFRHEGLTDLQKENSEANLSEIKANAFKLRSYPRRLVLELTNACNLNCIMCGRDVGGFSNNYLDVKYLNRFKDILECIEEVTLFGWGEPTIHPEFKEVIRFLNGYPVRKYFVTNGTTLKKIVDYLFDYKIDIMAVSLDGATAETNNRIRKNSGFNNIISGIKAIVQQRKERRVNYPYINFVFTMMKSNLYELPAMVGLAHDIGIEEVKAVYLTAFSEELENEVLLGKAGKVRKIFKETIKKGFELGIKIKLPYIEGEDIAGKKFHKDCFVGWRDYFVSCDGYVRPCQSISRKMFHITKYANFKDAWNSDEFLNFRSTVNNQQTMWDECKRCYQSSHANWNRKSSFSQTGQKFAPKWKGGCND